MATLNNPAGAADPDLGRRLDPYSGPQCPEQRADWVREALKARQGALRLLLSNLEMDSGIGRREPFDKATTKSIADLTEEYLLQSEKLFESTCALVRGKTTHGE
jgi:hypothetical protein